jgi:hypothetical protein
VVEDGDGGVVVVQVDGLGAELVGDVDEVSFEVDFPGGVDGPVGCLGGGWQVGCGVGSGGGGLGSAALTAPRGASSGNSMAAMRTSAGGWGL